MHNCIGNTVPTMILQNTYLIIIIIVAIVNNYRNRNPEIARKCFGNKSVLKNTFPIMHSVFRSSLHARQLDRSKPHH